MLNLIFLLLSGSAQAQIQEHVNVYACDLPITRSEYGLSVQVLKNQKDNVLEVSNSNRTNLENQHKVAIAIFQNELSHCQNDSDCSREISIKIKDHQQQYENDLKIWQISRQALNSDVVELYQCLYLRRWVGSFQEAVEDIPRVHTLSVTYRFLSEPEELNQVLKQESPTWHLEAAHQALMKKSVLIRWLYEKEGAIHHTTILTSTNRAASNLDFVNRLNSPPLASYKEESPISVASLVYTPSERNFSSERTLPQAAFVHESVHRWVLIPYLLNTSVIGKSK